MFFKYFNCTINIIFANFIIYNYFENNDINTLSAIFQDCYGHDKFNCQDISYDDILKYIQKLKQGTGIIFNMILHMFQQVI